MKSIYNIPKSYHRDSVVVYGRHFRHAPLGHPDWQKTRQESIANAEQHGLEVQARLTKQKGGSPLDLRERISGELTRPPAPNPGPQPNRGSEPGPPRNPFTLIIQQALMKCAHTPSQKAAREAQLLRLEAQRDNWEERAQATELRAVRDRDPATQRMRIHAQRILDETVENAASTRDQIFAAQDRLKMSLTDFVEPGAYWTECRSQGIHGEAEPPVEQA